MLSTRYLHLHEALGLGPMWLSRDAEIVPHNPAEAERKPQAVPAPETVSSVPQTAAPVTAPSVPQKTAKAVPHVPLSGAHAAILASLGLKTLRQREMEEAAEAEALTARSVAEELPADPDNTVAKHKEKLAGKVRPARVMVVSICPSPEDSGAGKLFSGKVGELLHNMLAAIGLAEQESHKTSWLDAAEFDPDPPHAKLARALPRLRAELELAEPQAVLFLGQFFEAPEQAGIMRQLCGGLPVFTVPHPARLLRQPQQKAEAWRTLKRLRTALAQQ